jgi:M6 family metalloprotease-like protein
MGAWDIMSQHFVMQGGPPPGLSSFTKIRLGWIQADQVVLVESGTSAMTFLAPLSKKAKTLTVKIPLSWGDYYLVENRQHAGYDRALSDTGLLVLKVSPRADEGYGTVKIMDAAPSARHFWINKK